MTTLVLQSHTEPLPYPWLADCLASVRAWAGANGFDYRFIDDVLFSVLGAEFDDVVARRKVVATDVARLLWLQRLLRDEYERVVWIDADVLVLEPDRLQLPPDDHAFGREVWVQRDGRRLRAYRKIHNAVMCFSRGNDVLDFYLHAARRIVLAHDGPMAPQLVGPKLLTALHNVVSFPVIETAAMLSPLVAADLLGGDGAALRLFNARSTVVPAALNLCGSMRAAGELHDDDLMALIARLRTIRPFADGV